MCKHLARMAAVLLIMLATVVVTSCGVKTPTITSLSVTSGPRSGYQNVTINGTGLSGITGVSFGSTNAVSFTAADPTRIVAKTPAGELGGAVDVKVATDHGAATFPHAYTYWDHDLELIKGNTTVTYTLEQIEAMSPVAGFWGAVNDKPYNTDQYKGVPLLTLLQAVGGWSPGEEIIVASADGFITTYTSSMLQQMADGTYPMWNVNGTPVVTDDRVAQPTVAYEMDAQGDGSSWKPLEAGKGPFRIVVMTAQSDRMSQGPPNPFLVVSAEIKPDPAAPAVTTPTTIPASSTNTTAVAGDAPTITALSVSSGPSSGYQSLTITGTGFSGVKAVSFGSSKATSFTVADATRIVVVTPAGEKGRLVDVTVSTASAAGTLPHAYTYWGYDLELVKGASTVTFTLDQLQAMPAVTGYWGAHKDPMPYNTDQYKGVPLLTLLKAVGGWSAGEKITARAADGFVTDYTPDILQQMANGTYPMWMANGTPVVTGDRFAQLTVAYAIDTAGDGKNWKPLEAGTGPLRIVAITAQADRVSQGKFNPFLITSVEVKAP